MTMSSHKLQSVKSSEKYKSNKPYIPLIQIDNENNFLDFRQRSPMHQVYHQNNNSCFSIDEIPTKENTERSSLILINNQNYAQENKENHNLKEYYELSKLMMKQPQNQKVQLRNGNENTFSNKMLRSKSSINTREYQMKGLSLQKKSIQEYSNYNINDYLPRDHTKIYLSNYSSNLNILDTQKPTPNIFKQNYNQSTTSLFQQQENPYQQQCSCQKPQSQQSQFICQQQNPNQIMLTQRSSVCSCQYSQSSASHSQHTSPHHSGGGHSKFRQNSQSNNSFHQNRSVIQSKSPNGRMHIQKSPTPQSNKFQSHLQSKSNLKSFAMMNHKNSENEFTQHKGRSAFKSNQKHAQDNNDQFNGYNTDDLVRDSSDDESESEFGGEISNTLLEVKQNIDKGFEQILMKNQNDLSMLERQQKEELALKILYQNSHHNQPQQNDIQQPIPYQQPQFPFREQPSNTILDYSQNNCVERSINDSQTKTIKNSNIRIQDFNLKQNENIGVKQRNAPALSLDQLSSGNGENIKNINGDYYLLTPLSVQNINIPSQSQINQQQYFSPCFNEQDTSKQQQNSTTMIKVLREMSVQTSQTFTMGDFEGGCSFLDKSELLLDKQPNQEHSKIHFIQDQHANNEVGCQYEPHSKEELTYHDSSNEDNKFQSNKLPKQITSLPPAQKRNPSLPKIYAPSSLQNGSIGICSIPTSKNSTIRTPQNHHFQSHQPNDLDDYYLPIDDESIQHQSQSLIGHSSAATSGRQVSTNTNQQVQNNGGGRGGVYINGVNSNYGGSNQNVNTIQSPFNRNLNQQNIINFDHFKSQCSDVKIRNSGDTDISNRIQRFNGRHNSQNNILQQQNQQKSSQQHHSHQISGSQSIVNIDPSYVSQHQRSQFTSLESNGYSPQKHQQQQILLNNHKFKQMQMKQRRSQDEGINDQDIEEESEVEEGTLNSNGSNQAPDNQLHTGDTFMKYQQELQNQQNMMNYFQNEEEDLQSEQIIYVDENINGESEAGEDTQRQNENNEVQRYENENNMNRDYNNFYQQTSSEHQTETQQQQEDEEFNYTIRLNAIKTTNQEITKKKSPLPPMYGQKLHSNPTQQSIHYLGNTSSTAGFPMQYGYNPSQQTGRKSPSIHSSFQSQKISHAPSQASLQASARSFMKQPKQNVSKLSFMEKVSLIQKHVRQYLQKNKDYSNSQNQFFGDSTIQKPHEESLSNISAQLLNSLKHHLNASSNAKSSKDSKPTEQSYHKNILESLNLTTGNTFIRETKQFTQGGGTQQLQRGEKTQALGNTTTGLVLYSGSTYDNRAPRGQQNDFQLYNNRGKIDTSQVGKQLQCFNNSDFDQNQMMNGTQLQQTQQSPNNNTSLLNLTEESNSAIFKLTPIASSQNVTHKSHFLNLNPNYTGHMNNNIERTTESNNLNYSYSELDSEYAGCGIPKDCAISPMSVKTTQSKPKSKGKISHTLLSRGGQNRMHIQKSDTVLSDQNSAHHNNEIINTSLLCSDVGDNSNKYSHKLAHLNTGVIGGNYLGISSPLSSDPQITASTNKTKITPTHSNQSGTIFLKYNHNNKQEHLLNMLKSEEFADEDLYNVSKINSNKDNNQSHSMNQDIFIDGGNIQQTLNASSITNQEQFEWKDIKPVQENQFKNMMMQMVMRQMSQIPYSSI